MAPIHGPSENSSRSSDDLSIYLKLPTELLTEIFSHFAGNSNELKALRLTSKFFSELARPILWRKSITIPVMIREIQPRRVAIVSGWYIVGDTCDLGSCHLGRRPPPPQPSSFRKAKSSLRAVFRKRGSYVDEKEIVPPEYPSSCGLSAGGGLQLNADGSYPQIPPSRCDLLETNALPLARELTIKAYEDPRSAIPHKFRQNCVSTIGKRLATIFDVAVNLQKVYLHMLAPLDDLMDKTDRWNFLCMMCSLCKGRRSRDIDFHLTLAVYTQSWYSFWPRAPCGYGIKSLHGLASLELIIALRIDSDGQSLGDLETEIQAVVKASPKLEPPEDISISALFEPFTLNRLLSYGPPLEQFLWSCCTNQKPYVMKIPQRRNRLQTNGWYPLQAPENRYFIHQKHLAYDGIRPR